MTILAITLNPHRVPFQAPQSKSAGSSGGTYYSQAVGTAGKVAEHGVSLFAPAAEIISGAVALFLGLVSEYVLKDSVLDKMSKVISFLGLGSIAVGGWGLFKYIKKQTTPPEALPTGIEPTNASAIKNAETALTQIDKNFTRGYDSSGAIFTENQSEPTLQSAARNILDLYLSPEVVNIVNSHSSGPEPLITGISNSSVSIKDLKERIAALLAFVKPEDVHIAVTDGTDEIGLAKEPMFNDNDVNPIYHRMLPDDFINSFRLGKAFVQNYVSDNSFKQIVDLPLTNDLLKPLITNLTESAVKTTNENLNTLQFALDNLEALKKVINILVSPSGSDSKTIRNLSVVKQGLICAFQLQGVDAKDLNVKFLEILKRSDTGVEARLEVVKNKLESLKEVINDPKFPLQKKESGAVVFNENIRDIKQNEFVLRATSA